MAGESHRSDQILTAARRSLHDQRAGGRRNSIGRRSAALKREHALRQAKRAAMTVIGILFAAMAVGVVIDGIGWGGIIVTMLAIFAAVTAFAVVPKVKVPSRESLTKGDGKSLVGRTELWLESQRAALPAPAVQLVDHIGLQLDALGQQLDGLDPNAPAARDVRQLVGETLPGLVSTYTSIPRHLRAEASAGASPDQQLTDSLGKISAEIDSVTRQLAAGAIDNLAITTRYLDYKYGGAIEAPKETN